MIDATHGHNEETKQTTFCKERNPKSGESVTKTYLEIPYCTQTVF